MNTTPPGAGPLELESAPDQPVSIHLDPRGGFSIAIPQGWTPDGKAMARGETVYVDENRSAELRLARAPRFAQALARFRAATTRRSETLIDDTDYRAVAVDGAGRRVRFRALRTPGGTIEARMRYPAAEAGALDPIAAVTLNSLTLIP